jgi:hypothetical protein
MENVVRFPYSVSRHASRQTRVRKNMQTFVFRSYDLIVESDEADLVRDVCFAVDRAQTKLERIQRRLKDVREEAAAQVELLSAAETKLTAAIVAALLSTRGRD